MNCPCNGNPHTLECLYEHFLAYTGYKDTPELKIAYEHGYEAGAPKWRPIEDLPKDMGMKMFVAKAINVCNGFTGGKPYSSDPWCVWQELKGTFARWNHNFPPTHFLLLPPQNMGE